MRIRIVQITTRRSGAQARHDDLRDDDVLTIGRGTDNDLSLPGLSVSLHHATIRRVSSEIRVEGVEGNVVAVNGRPCTTRAIEPGDTLQIGSFEIRVLARTHGEDLTIEVEEVERAGDAREALARRTRLGVGRGLFSGRRLAVLGLVLVALVLGVAPLRAAFWSETDDGRPGPPLENASVGLVQTWSTGPISAPHAQIATECGRCHVTGFSRVRDVECLACHARIEAHATVEHSPVELRDMRCTSCHEEHAGPGGLSRLEASSCAPCHGQLASLDPAAPDAVATDFDEDHPQFRLTLAADPATKRRERVTWTPTLQEATGLVFSHVRHVGQAVESRATGRSEYLRCDSCHTVDATGLGYDRVGFAEHCQSCHSLGFDEDFPETQAHHGDPAVMRERLLEFYAAVALGGRIPPQRAAGVVRAVPGTVLSPAAKRAALAWAEAQARTANVFLMEGDKRCGMCHQTVSGSARDGGLGVEPVDVPRTWLPHAAFSHRSHMPSACSTCHAAITVFDPLASPDVPRPGWAAPGAKPYGLLTPTELAALHRGATPSDAASDVSIPGLDTCRECHGGARAPLGRIASQCVLCHSFHRPALPPMSLGAGPGAPR